MQNQDVISSVFRTLLKAACAAARLDEKELAARAGISTNRIYELANERVRPTDQEVIAVLTATGVSTDEIIASIRRADEGATAFELTTRLRAVVVLQADVAFAVQTASLKIDGLCVVADPLSYEGFSRRLARLGFKPVPEPKRSKALARRYQKHLFLPDAGVAVQLHPSVAQTKARYARLELTRFSAKARKAAAGVLRLLDLSTHTVTRIDLAIDVDVPFGALSLLPSDDWKKAIVVRYRDGGWRLPKASEDHERTYFGERGFESVYEFRARGSKVVRVYDWNRRHARKQDAPPRTRIEFQLRSRTLRLADLEALPNPFEELRFHAIGVPRKQPTYLDGLVLRECAFYGLHAVLPKLSKGHRSRIRAALKDCMVAPQPSAVFDTQWLPVLRRFKKQLGFA